MLLLHDYVAAIHTHCRDDPKSTQCLVVSNCAEKGCDIAIEGDSLFSALR